MVGLQKGTKNCRTGLPVAQWVETVRQELLSHERERVSERAIE